MQSQIASMEKSMQDKEGTIETLERQLIQAGIKGKVQSAEMEIHKKKVETQAKVTMLGEDAKRTQTNKVKQEQRDYDSGFQQGQVAAKEAERSLKDGVQRNLEEHSMELEKSRLKKSVGNE